MKQYNPSKPAKYGLHRSLCDAKVPYTYFTLPYAGRPEQQGENIYYVTGTDEYTKVFSYKLLPTQNSCGEKHITR